MKLNGNESSHAFWLILSPHARNHLIYIWFLRWSWIASVYDCLFAYCKCHSSLWRWTNFSNGSQIITWWVFIAQSVINVAMKWNCMNFLASKSWNDIDVDIIWIQNDCLKFRIYVNDWLSHWFFQSNQLWWFIQNGNSIQIPSCVQLACAFYWPMTTKKHIISADSFLFSN